MNEKQTVRFNRPFDIKTTKAFCKKIISTPYVPFSNSLDSKTSCDPTCETAARKKKCLRLELASTLYY